MSHNFRTIEPYRYNWSPGSVHARSVKQRTYLNLSCLSFNFLIRNYGHKTRWHELLGTDTSYNMTKKCLFFHLDQTKIIISYFFSYVTVHYLPFTKKVLFISSWTYCIYQNSYDKLQRNYRTQRYTVKTYLCISFLKQFKPYRYLRSTA